MIKGLLKKLCIFLLIGLPILFVNYSNAGYLTGTEGLYIFPVNDTTVLGDYTYNFDYAGTPYTNDNKLAYKRFYYYQSYKLNFQYAWKDGQLYFRSNYYSRTDSTDKYNQGYINKWCISDNLNYCLDISNANDHYKFTTTQVLNSGVGSLQYVIFGQASSSWNQGAGANTHTYYCLDDGDFYYCASCLASSSSNFICKSGLTGTSLNLTVGNVQEYSWDSSPIIPYNAPIESGNSTIPKKYTNGDIIGGYEYLGLDVGYCYGGFDIDNIFLPNETIEDFTGYKFGYGATVFDLYNLYSGAYSTPKTFFAQMSQAYSNGQINRFKNEPKALIMFVQQFMSAKSRGRINVGFYDLWDYCNLKFNSDPDAEYTGHNETGKRGADQNKTNNQNKGGFQFSGDNALNRVVGTGGTGFSNPAEFFGNITSIFQNGLGVVDTNYTGMIPTYILMFMFALILIRIIKH